MVQDIMAREQQMLGEDLGHFLTRLEGRPVSTDDAMALTLQHVMDSTFPVRLSISHSLLISHPPFLSVCSTSWTPPFPIAFVSLTPLFVFLSVPFLNA